MKEKRFLRVFTFSLILGLGILLSLQFSVYAQTTNPYINPNSPIRTSSILGYPTSYLGGLGTGLYPGLGLGLMPGLGLPPLSQQVSLAQVSPLTSSTLNSSYYRDIFTTHGTQARTFTNPFATYGSTGMVYSDPFSQAAANTMSYSNIFGVNMQTGQGFYRDPLYTTGGKYINYASPVGGFSSDMGYSMSPLGGATHVGSSLTTPWTHYSTDINTAYGLGAAGTSVAHAAFGMPTVFNMVGMNPAVAGTMALMTYGSETAAMDRMLSNTYAYTKEGMPFIPVASYFNPASVGGTNYFFAGDISYVESGTVGTGPLATGYSIVQEIPESLVPIAGAAVAASSGVSVNPLFAGYVGSGPLEYSGWTSGPTSSGAASTGGWVGTAASPSAYGGWSGSSAGWGTVSGGWGAGAATGGWGGGAVGGGGGSFTGAGSGATYGGVNLGW